MVNANMIWGGGHLRYKIIGISQYLGHEEGGGVHEHLQDLPQICSQILINNGYFWFQ